MAQSDIETFLQDLLRRYDPAIDLTDGARAQTELIQPILGRIGTDPFDDDIETFVNARIAQAFPDLSISDTDALKDTLISPMRVLLEPIVREIKLVKLRQSVANVEQLGDDEVDALMANFFEARKAGGLARGVVRVYFTAPVTVSFTLIQVASTRGGLRYTPSPAQTITKDEMLLNREGQEYYVDISYVAEKRGDEYNVDRGEIISIANLASATRVKNVNRFSNGQPRENSLAFVGRVESKLSDRTLTVARGILSELTDNFPAVRRVQVVGFKDPEMLRDVVKGGSLGPILPDDAYGHAYGVGTTVDDGNGDATTKRITAADGHFVSRIGSAGSDPSGYYLSIMYFVPAAVVFADVPVLEVLSDTDILIDYEIPPVPIAISSDVYWSLRRQELTISDIPGGVTLPDTPQGELVIRPGEVHIGGKTDVYIAGEVVAETVAIVGIADEVPLARGSSATTQAATPGSEDVVIIQDPPGGAAALVAQLADGLYSLVLDEGVDAGAYDIREVVDASPWVEVRVSVALTGTAGGLLWKIVDEINVELTEPKDIKVLGADLTVVAGNAAVTTLSSTNFIDANVLVNDVLRMDADIVGGDYTITAVGAVTLQIDPTPERTISGVNFTIFRPTGSVLAPVVRVTALELLDSGGAPNGVKIPYSEPLTAITKGFQNEGSGLEFEGYPSFIGLVGGASYTPFEVVFPAARTLIFDFYDATKVYAGKTTKLLSSGGSYALTLSGTMTITQIAAAINADLALIERQVRASVLTYDTAQYLGIYCPEFVVLNGGTANTLLGFATAGRLSTNSQMGLPSTYNPRVGDLIEFISGNNTGTTRVLRGKDVTDTRFTVSLGLGPTDEDIHPDMPLHEVATLFPEVGVRVRGGRPSVGSARVYFQAPTSAEFRYGSTELSVLVGTDTLVYRPDPENDRILVPAQPLTDLPQNGVTALGSASDVLFSDTTTDFQALNIRPGDLLDILYSPITSSAALAAGSITDIVGKTLIIRLDESPWITINFPVPLTREDIASYINEQVGVEIASIDGTGFLVLQAMSSLITLREDSSVFSAPNPLLLAAPTVHATSHAGAGTYIIAEVNATTLILSAETPLGSGTTEVTDTAYRIRRNLQRISSTEMNSNVDSTGLYYVDVELLSLAPGDRYNAPGDLVMEVTGSVADGYRLYTENNTLSFSRAEKLYAGLSRTILLVGSSDSPSEYVQLSQQNIQVSYDRSAVVDDVQSFCDSDGQRVVTEEIVVRHLLPHYVNLGWRYVGGELETTMRAAMAAVLEEIEAYEELEVIDLTRVMTARGATSIYSLAPESPTGRSAPVMVVTYHDVDRRVRAAIVKDYVKTSRTQRFIADNLAVVRVAPGVLR